MQAFGMVSWLRTTLIFSSCLAMTEVKMDSASAQSLVDFIQYQVKRIDEQTQKIHRLEMHQEDIDRKITEESDPNQFALIQENVTMLVEKLKENFQHESSALSEALVNKKLDNLDEMSKINIMRSCHELSQNGITRSGMYSIDPDGHQIGFPPIKAYCDFEEGFTEFLHDKEETFEVEHCGYIGCAKYPINYGVPNEQIEALIQLSDNCHQQLAFECFLAPLAYDDTYFGWWLDKNGTKRHFFSGSQIDAHVCHCGEAKNCHKKGTLDYSCNCDAKRPEMTADIGSITAKEILPITLFAYGPLDFAMETAKVTIGRLKCSGQVQLNSNEVTCNFLKMKGHVKPGIYILKGQYDRYPRLAYCHMDRYSDYTNTDMEEFIGYLSVKPLPAGVVFHAYRDVTGYFSGLITYNHVVTNIGDSFNATSGIFTAPLNGTYEFSAHYGKSDNCDVAIYKNQVIQFRIRSRGSHDNVGQMWHMKLVENDQIHLQVTHGRIYNHPEHDLTTFTGHLIEAD